MFFYTSISILIFDFHTWSKLRKIYWPVKSLALIYIGFCIMHYKNKYQIRNLLYLLFYLLLFWIKTNNTDSVRIVPIYIRIAYNLYNTLNIQCLILYSQNIKKKIFWILGYGFLGLGFGFLGSKIVLDFSNYSEFYTRFQTAFILPETGLAVFILYLHNKMVIRKFLSKLMSMDNITASILIHSTLTLFVHYYHSSFSI